MGNCNIGPPPPSHKQTDRHTRCTFYKYRLRVNDIKMACVIRNVTGATVGTLNVWVAQTSDKSLRPIWSLTGHQGANWTQATAQIPAQADSYQVRVLSFDFSKKNEKRDPLHLRLYRNRHLTQDIIKGL